MMLVGISAQIVCCISCNSRTYIVISYVISYVVHRLELTKKDKGVKICIFNFHFYNFFSRDVWNNQSAVECEETVKPNSGCALKTNFLYLGRNNKTLC